MADDPNAPLAQRVTALEAEVVRLTARADLTAGEADAARFLAAGADHDVSEVRAELQAHRRLLQALRETQVEQGRRLDGIDGRLDGIDGRLDGIDGRFDQVDRRLDSLESEMRTGFATMGAGMAQIATLLGGDPPTGANRS